MQYNVSIKKNDNLIISKKQNISTLKDQIRIMEEDIENRRRFFREIQEPTDPFLRKFENSYITSYIPAKVTVCEEISYHENNIMEIIGIIIYYNTY